jgi:drug/metabolite transporter (DMT)-like permease
LSKGTVVFHSYIKSHLLVLLSTVFVAASFLASEKLAGIIHPVSLTLLRFIISALILLPFVLWKREHRKKVISTFPRASVISLFYSLYFILFFESLKTTTALNTGTLYTLAPFLTALLSMLFFREETSFKRLVVYLIGAAGTCWVIFRGDLQLFLSFSLNRGDLVFLVGIFSMCCYSISMKQLYRKDNMIVLVFCTLLGGSMWMGLAMVFFQLPLQWHLLKGEHFAYLGYLAVFATLGSSYLLQKTVVVLGPGRVSAYSYLNPAFVALILLLVGGVSIPMAVVPGIVLSTLATVFLQFQPTVIPLAQPDSSE